MRCGKVAVVSVLIDEPRWWFRGRKWCHMVSDLSLDELHDFAQGVGIPRRAFQGDHYDIPEEYRPDMLVAGAIEVESRELVRRLRDAGLRLSPAARRAAVDVVDLGE
jgi:Protein of unknown function (DUF4031)